MSIKPRRIELLAPAKDLACGIEAINHGADAVYIGAPKFVPFVIMHICIMSVSMWH